MTMISNPIQYTDNNAEDRSIEFVVLCISGHFPYPYGPSVESSYVGWRVEFVPKD